MMTGPSTSSKVFMFRSKNPDPDMEFETTEGIEIVYANPGNPGTTSDGKRRLKRPNSYGNGSQWKVDNDFVLKLIRRIETVPMLYNQNDENFRNISKKQAAWQAIADEFGHSAVWCTRKWISLRDYYVKRKKLQRSGRPARPWCFYDELKFLNCMYGEDDVPSVKEIQSSKFKRKEPQANEPEAITYTLSEDVLTFQEEEDDEVYNNDSSGSGNENELVMEDSYQDDTTEEYENENDDDGWGYRTNTNSDAYSYALPAEIEYKRRKVVVNDEDGGSSNLASNTVKVEGNRFSNGNQDGWDDDFYDENEDSNERNADDDDNDSVSKDPYDLFCLSVAAQMKKLPRAKAIQLQIGIMELVYKCEVTEDGQPDDHN